MSMDSQHHRAILQDVARRAMLQRGLLPDFPAAVLRELGGIEAPATTSPDTMSGAGRIRDLRDLLWTSIDNDDSRDLDQLTFAEPMRGDRVKVVVAVADVDALVKNGSAIDEHARHNTTSVYTAAQVFPMLPEKLSTGLTSLNPDEDRLSVAVEMVIAADGSIAGSDVYRAVVRNHAKLAYAGVAAWLEGSSPAPEAMSEVEGLSQNLLIQDRVAQRMRGFRRSRGALSLETVEARPILKDDTVQDLKAEGENRAKIIIEDFMIGANGVTAGYLSERGFPSIRRVVRKPRRWERIVELAAQQGHMLPRNPDSGALDDFLAKEKAADPLRFPDLSLAVIKLLGPGEYVAEVPGAAAPGHFGLATKDYGHSTAPNRRYTDLVTQRLLKAALGGLTSPYGEGALESLASHCTRQEDAAGKVERQVGKSAAALLLKPRIGEQFDAIVTGAAPKGTWVRLLSVPVEGRLARGFEGADVGDRLRVKLMSVDVERGFIDFARAKSGRSG